MFAGQPSVNVTPHDQTVEVTHTASFVAEARGIGLKQFTYQWMHDGAIIKSGNHPTLYIHTVTEVNGGNYWCIVSNIYGDKNTSNAVVLNITSMYVHTYIHRYNMCT